MSRPAWTTKADRVERSRRGRQFVASVSDEASARLSSIRKVVRERRASTPAGLTGAQAFVAVAHPRSESHMSAEVRTARRDRTSRRSHPRPLAPNRSRVGHPSPTLLTGPAMSKRRNKITNAGPRRLGLDAASVPQGWLRITHTSRRTRTSSRVPPSRKRRCGPCWIVGGPYSRLSNSGDAHDSGTPYAAGDHRHPAEAAAHVANPVAQAANENEPHRSGDGTCPEAMVAGTGFEPVTFRL